MRNKRDLLARINRLQQLVEGLNIELVQVAIGCEPFTQEERLAYCRGVEEMVHAAKSALVRRKARPNYCVLSPSKDTATQSGLISTRFTGSRKTWPANCRPS